MTTKTPNTKVAKELRLDPSAVSRLRSGDRTPSFDTMNRVSDAFGWPCAEQALARQRGAWSTHFERVIQSFFDNVDA